MIGRWRKLTAFARLGPSRQEIEENRGRFACKCGCGGNGVSDELVRRFLEVERRTGKLMITSGWRCAEHNREVGGVAGSAHVKGLAVDVKVDHSRLRHYVVKALIEEGFVRYGIAGAFIHFDIDTDKDQDVCWVY